MSGVEEISVEQFERERANLAQKIYTGEVTNAEWGAIAYFDDLPVPPFPVKRLTKWLRNYVVEVARATQTPVDLAAFMVLGCLAAANAGATIEIKPGWFESLNLFLACFLPPGSRKTAVHSLAKRPLEARERELVAAAQPLIAQARFKRETLETEREELKKKIAKTNAPDLKKKAAEAKAKTNAPTNAPDTLNEITFLRQHAEVVLAELQRMEIPPEPRLLVSGDITQETLATYLHWQRGRLAIFSDEGELFEILGGRYNKGAPNIEVILKGHTGESVRVDRRGRSEFIESARLTICLTPQPAVLKGLAGTPQFRGKGLLGRILYALPESGLGTRSSREEPPDVEVGQTYETNLGNLLKRGFPLLSDSELAGFPSLELTAEAREALIQFTEELEPRLGEDGDLHRMADWAGKLAGAIARIAGNLHLAEQIEKPQASDLVPAATMEAAIEIGRYLLAHAVKVFAEIEADPGVQLAQKLLRWIERHVQEDTKSGTFSFTRQMLWQAVKGGRIKETADLDRGLLILERHRYLRTAHPTAREKSLFLVNPALFGNPASAPKNVEIQSRPPAPFTPFTPNQGAETGELGVKGVKGAVQLYLKTQILSPMVLTPDDAHGAAEDTIEI